MPDRASSDHAEPTTSSPRPAAGPAAEPAPGGRPTFESCVERLATAIRLGVYPYGSALPPERELAGLLGVSRATVREAIAALRAAGMVAHHPRPRRRDRRRPRAADARERAGRRRRGGVAAARAAGRARLPPRGRARRLLRRGDGRPLGHATRRSCAPPTTGSGAAQSPAEHRQADSRLHLAIAALTGSAYLVDAVTQVQAAVHEMLLAIPVLPTNIEHSNAQHAAIVAAVEAGEPERARRAMEEHCDDTAALLRGLLR